MKNDDILINYASIEQQIRRARLERSVYVGTAIANAITAMMRAGANVVARLDAARDEAPRLSTRGRLSPR